MIKISVIIPVYNAEKFLEKCLDSFVNQTLKDIEIICIDDGSVDKSLIILQQYEAKYDNIYVFFQSNQGAGAARNKGLELARGEYVYFFDADDFANYKLCEEVYNIALENNKPDLIRFKGKAFDNKSQKVVKLKYLEMDSCKENLFNNFISLNNIIQSNVEIPCSPWLGICKKEFLIKNDIKFDNFICCNDVGFFYNSLLKASSIYLINKSYVFYRINTKTNLSANRAKNFECELLAYKRLDELTKNLSLNIRKYILRTFLINHIFLQYKKYIFSKHGKNIYTITKDFLESVNIKEIGIKFNIINPYYSTIFLFLYIMKNLPYNKCKLIFKIIKNL